MGRTTLVSESTRSTKASPVFAASIPGRSGLAASRSTAPETAIVPSGRVSPAARAQMAFLDGTARYSVVPMGCARSLTTAVSGSNALTVPCSTSMA